MMTSHDRSRPTVYRVRRPRRALLAGLPCERCGQAAYALELGRSPRVIHLNPNVSPCPGPVAGTPTRAPVE